MDSRSYGCGHCGSHIASQRGYSGHDELGRWEYIYICHRCGRPTYFDIAKRATPGALFGESIGDVEKTVDDLYEEARRSYAASSFTATVLCCRKLLMHIAVSQGSEAGGSFVSYVEFLAAKGYVPPGAKPWVDHIRQKGNEANHDIVIMSRADAEDLLSFSGMLLKLVFEFPAMAARRATPTS